MADNRTPPAVAPVSDAVLEQIHYDTLWETAQDALNLYSGQRWTARGDDDPAVTMMQAFAFGVSDVSYRHTLPLVDLLSVKKIPDADDRHLDHSAGIFAHEFGPEQALTSSPVTLEDYRRAILDLTIEVSSGEWFCFRDVQIDRLTVNNSYGYVYNPDIYSFEFVSSASKPESLFRVQGAYGLWVTLNPGVPRKKAEKTLTTWLKDHRNLCEWEIEQVQFITVAPQSPVMYLTVDDDMSAERINLAVAQAVWAINQVLLPVAKRQTADERLAAGEPAEEVYHGPCLKHGWLAQLSPRRPINAASLDAYTVPLQALSAAVVGAVQGIIAIEWGDSADIKVKKNQQVQLWVDPAGAITEAALKNIRIYKRGQDITESASPLAIVDLYTLINESACQATTEVTRSVPYGRYRHPGFYRSVGASLPQVYGLQQGKEAFAKNGDRDARNQLLFLRSFEQLLANSADQLEKLPGLMAFDGRDTQLDVWGASDWPSKEADSLTYEQTQTLMDSLPETSNTLAITKAKMMRDPEKELAILNYLLGYFGEARAARAMSGNFGDPGEFVYVQQGFLRQVTRLAYERAAISISKVSALQRKIAARLGVGKALFDETLQKPDSPFPGGTLPFYIIEHQELLPRAPLAEDVSPDWTKGQEAEYVDSDEKTLTLKLSGNKLVGGQLIDLQGTPGGSNAASSEPLMAIVLHTVQGDTVTVQLDENIRLKNSLTLLMGNQYTWKWRVSQTWLKRVVHDLDYVADKDDKSGIILLVGTSYPTGLKKGDRFALRPKARWLYQPTKADLNEAKGSPDIVVEVTEADGVGGILKVKWIASKTPDINVDAQTLVVPPVKLDVTEEGSAAWPDQKTVTYAWSVPYQIENFSFTLSVVLDRALLKGGNPGELSQWIENTIREEMPSHLNLQLHWIDDFSNFALRYRNWQNSGRPVGDQSYELLRLLGIGERPVDMRAGIGFLRVASVEESDNIEKDLQQLTTESAKKRKVESYSVIHIEK